MYSKANGDLRRWGKWWWSDDKINKEKDDNDDDEYCNTKWQWLTQLQASISIHQWKRKNKNR